MNMRVVGNLTSGTFLALHISVILLMASCNDPLV